MAPTKSTSTTVLNELHLAENFLGHLPPEVRDKLLAYVRAWGSPHELLQIVEQLRTAHGPLLFLLDIQAQALLDLGDVRQALEVIERRQRRSTTVASQAMEARALLALGHEEHARMVVDDISSAYPRHFLALETAAHVYAALGDTGLAESLLTSFLEQRPGHLDALLALTELARQQEQPQQAVDYLSRLGSGIPAHIDDLQLQRFAAQLEATGQTESLKACRLELAHRRRQQFQELQKALTPFTSHQAADRDDPADYYRHISGPESIPVSRDEKRSITLEAVRHFGFTKLRDGQMEAIASILRGESILTVMPTGAGKSLCYQLPALTLPKATLVISPLIALMKDQVESLPALARRQATFINSTLSDTELSDRMAGIAQGEYKLIYAAPERLRQRPFLRAIRNAGLDLFVVDEAHCVSLWGHDFRPDYLFIQEARRELGNPPALAMTATAPPRVRDEIVDYIRDDGEPATDTNTDVPAPAAGLGPRVLSLDIFRHNLHLSAVRFHNEEEKLAALRKFVTETEGSGIVYVNSRHKSESLAFELQQAGVAAEAYHAGLSNRGGVQDRFMSDKTRVVVATVAFGMGIDKANIRFIVHFHPPRSLASYYQEVGRAGRDGKNSQGVLFFSNNDWANLRRWAKADEYSVDFLERVYAAVANQLGVRLPTSENDHASEHDGGEMEGAAVPALVGSVVGPVDPRRLQQVLNTDETTMRVAVSILERADLLARSFDFPTEVTIGLPRKLSKAAQADPDLSYLQRGLALRAGSSATFATSDVAAFMEWPLHETEAWLLDWQSAGFISVQSGRRVMLVELPPRPADVRERLERLLLQTGAVAQRRIDDVIGYATAETCRHGYISTHFGSPPRNRCDVCDNCTGIRPEIPDVISQAAPLPDDADLEPMILDCLVSLPKPVGRSGLARILAGSLRAPVKPDQARHHGRLKALGEAVVMNYIDDLLESNRVRQYERNGYPVLAATMRGRSEADAWLAQHPELDAYGEAPEAVAEESEPEPAEGDKYTALQKALWLWRKRTAEEMGQPPYVIMSNELMLTIAEQRPANEDELGRLPGMGKQRLLHYGPVILDMIQLHPTQEGDRELIQTQRTEQADVAKQTRSRLQTDNEPAVAPAVQRRLYLKMQELRQKIAVQTDSKPYLVASNTILKAIAAQAPKTVDELESIVGFRSSALHNEASTILAIVAALTAETDSAVG